MYHVYLYVSHFNDLSTFPFAESTLTRRPLIIKITKTFRELLAEKSERRLDQQFGFLTVWILFFPAVWIWWIWIFAHLDS